MNKETTIDDWLKFVKKISFKITKKELKKIWTQANEQSICIYLQ